MDISQAPNARAVLTIGKVAHLLLRFSSPIQDMTFRDYAQGAFRMRGIGRGQTVTLYLIPEVEELINHDLKVSDAVLVCR